MVGMNPDDGTGKIVPMKAAAARQSAGVVDYQREHDHLQRKLDAVAVKPTGRLSVPLRNPDCLPDVAEILHGLASDITAVHNEIHDPELRLLKLGHRVREAESRLRRLKL